MKKKICILWMVLSLVATACVFLFFTACGSGDGEGNGAQAITPPDQLVGSFAVGDKSGSVTLIFSKASSQSLQNDFQIMEVTHNVTGVLVIEGTSFTITGTMDDTGSLNASASGDLNGELATFAITGTIGEDILEGNSANLIITLNMGGKEYTGIINCTVSQEGVEPPTVYTGYFGQWLQIGSGESEDLADISFDIGFSFHAYYNSEVAGDPVWTHGYVTEDGGSVTAYPQGWVLILGTFNVSIPSVPKENDPITGSWTMLEYPGLTYKGFGVLEGTVIDAATVTIEEMTEYEIEDGKLIVSDEWETDITGTIYGIAEGDYFKKLDKIHIEGDWIEEQEGFDADMVFFGFPPSE